MLTVNAAVPLNLFMFFALARARVYCICIHTLPRGGMYRVVHSWRPRDISRAEGIIKPFLRTYQEIHLYRVMYIESVRINTSQIMTREGCTGNVGQSNLVHVDSTMLGSTIQYNAIWNIVILCNSKACAVYTPAGQEWMVVSMHTL